MVTFNIAAVHGEGMEYRHRPYSHEESIAQALPIALAHLL